jgi:hypothetical protein
VRWAKLTSLASRAIAIAFALVALVALVQVGRTSIADSLAGAPRVSHAIGGLSIDAPANWVLGGNGISDPDGIVIVTLDRESRVAGSVPPELIALWVGSEAKRAKERGFDEVAVASERSIVLPAGWEGSELEVSSVDAMGYRQRVRAIACGKHTPDGVILASIYTPATIATMAPGFLAALLASVHEK